MNLPAEVLETQDAPGRHFKDGVSQSGRERNNLFLNRPGDGYVDMSGVSGLDSDSDGRAFALIDHDRDGFLDVATVNANAPFFTLHRNGIGALRGADTRGRFLVVALEGANRSPDAQPGLSSRAGYGARVEVDLAGGPGEPGNVTLVREHRAGGGLAAQNSSQLHFGIGTHARAAEVRVHWPSGRIQVASDVAAGQRVSFREPGFEGDDGAIQRVAYRDASPRSGHPEPHMQIADDRVDADVPRLPVDSLKDGATLRVFTSTATWCKACVNELPEVASLRGHFDSKTVALYGAPVDDTDTLPKLAAWNARHRPAYTLLDPTVHQALVAGVSARVKEVLIEDALPASVVTDAEGRILWTRWGLPTISDLRALLADVRADAPDAASTR